MRLSHDDHIRRGRIRLSIERAAELERLRDRETSLVTLSTEAPRQLAIVRERIADIERRAN